MKCICYNVEAPLAPANQVNDAPVMDQPALPGPIIEAQDQAPVVPAQVQEPPPIQIQVQVPTGYFWRFFNWRN